VPFKGSIEVRPEEFIIFLSSNGVETTRDFANRSSIIRIRKKPTGHPFRKYPEGDMLNHVKINQPYYLGCVFSVIRAWHAAGKPRTTEARHDFRDWVQILDWIVQELFKMSPLMDGHREAQDRVSNPDLVFLRAVAVAYGRTECLGEAQTATEIAQVCESEGINIPGVRQFQAIEMMAKPVGSCLGRSFKDGSTIEIEGYRITREIIQVKRGDGNGYTDKKAYRFEKIVGSVFDPVPNKFSPEAEKSVFSSVLSLAHKIADGPSRANAQANHTNHNKG